MRSVIDQVSCCYRLVIHSVKTLTIITNLDLSVNNRGTKTVPIDDVSDHVLTVETLVSQLGGTRKTCENLANEQTCHNWVARWNLLSTVRVTIGWHAKTLLKLLVCHLTTNYGVSPSENFYGELWRISK